MSEEGVVPTLVHTWKNIDAISTFVPTYFPQAFVAALQSQTSGVRFAEVQLSHNSATTYSAMATSLQGVSWVLWQRCGPRDLPIGSDGE